MAVTANLLQISKGTNVKAVLRNLHHRSAPPANCSPLYLHPLPAGFYCTATKRLPSRISAQRLSHRLLDRDMFARVRRDVFWLTPSTGWYSEHGARRSP